MQQGTEILFFNDIKMMSSESPLKQYDGVFIGTKNYVFIIPKKTVGFYYLVTTFKSHAYFIDHSVEEGCAKLIAEAESVEALENMFIALLEDDSKYVHKLSDKLWVKLNKFFSTFNFRFGKTKMNWSACIIKGKEKGNALKAFYSNILAQ
jgi:hypothetical protein